MTTQPRATVRTLVLDNPDTLAAARAVAKRNCHVTFEQQANRVQHFVRWIRELGKTPVAVVVVLLNVDDPNGGVLADILMPGADWQAVRDRGEAPFARGVAGRESIQEALDLFDKEASKKLRLFKGTCVVVVDHQVAEVFEAKE